MGSMKIQLNKTSLSQVVLDTLNIIADLWEMSILYKLPVKNLSIGDD